MCPDSELLSAYFDGEIPEPWKSRMETHVASCSSCRERLDGFSLLRSAMADDAGRSGADEGCGRAWERIEADIQKREGSKKRLSFWVKSVSIPLPLAAAALLAIALVPAASIIALARSRGTGMAAASPSPAGSGPVIAQASYVDASGDSLKIPADASFQDIDSLIRFLDAQNIPVTISVELPADRNLGYSGPPEIIKVSDSEARKASQ